MNTVELLKLNISSNESGECNCALSSAVSIDSSFKKSKN